MKTVLLIEKLYKSKNKSEIKNLLLAQSDINLFFNYYMSQSKINFDIVSMILDSGVCLNQRSEIRQDYSNYRLLFEYSIEHKQFEKVAHFLIKNHFENYTILEKICIYFTSKSSKTIKYLSILFNSTELFLNQPVDTLKLIVSENQFGMLKWLYDNGFNENINVIKEKNIPSYLHIDNLTSPLIDCIENKENKSFLKKLKYLETIGLTLKHTDSELLNAVGYLDDVITYKYLEKKQIYFKNKQDKHNIITDIFISNSYNVIKYLLQKGEINLNEFHHFDYNRFADGINTHYPLDYLAHACIFHNRKNKQIFELLVAYNYNWKNQEKGILEYISNFSLIAVQNLLDYLFTLNIYTDDLSSISTNTDCGQAILDYLEIKNIEKEKEKLSCYLTHKKNKTIKI